MFNQKVFRPGALLALACLAGAAVAPGTANAQPPDAISVRVHQGERGPSGSEQWTGGNIFGYEEGDQIRFRFTLSANEPAAGQLEVHFTRLGNGCEFFEGAFEVLDIVTASGATPTVTPVGTPVAEGDEWVQTLNVDFAAAGEAILIYGLTLTDEAAACTGSSQHSRLFPGDVPGDVHQMGRQNVPVAPPAEPGQEPPPPPPVSLLEVVKDLRPTDDAGRFDLIINGNVEVPDAGAGDTTGPVVVDPGGHVVGENAGTATDLADYRISIACENQAGEPVPTVPVPDGFDEVLFEVVVDEGDHVVCTIRNRSSADYDGGDTDADPFDSPFEGVGTGGDPLTTASPSAPTADPGTDALGPAVGSGGGTGGAGPTMDPEILGLAAPNELPRTGLPYLPSVFAGVSLIALGQAARAAGGRGRRSA